jgi:transcriptional regulator with XRE-family HTH domain
VTSIGGRILALRTGKGLTQRDLAEPNYTAAYVSSVENGHRVPSSDALAHFAARLSVDVTQLTTGRHPGDALSVEIDLLAGGQSAAWLAQRAADPSEPPTRRAAAEVLLGRRCLESGAPDDAVGHFERARRLVPATLAHLRTPAVAGLVLCARAQGDPGYAAYLLTGFRDELHRAGLPDPTSVLAVHALLALCQHDLGEDATAAASTALALAGPFDAGGVVAAHVATARTLAAESHLPEARAALAAAGSAALEAWLADEIAGAYRIRARGRLSSGDLAGALTDLTAARQHSTGPAAMDALVDLAEVHRALGDPATARELLSAPSSGSDAPAGSAEVRRARAHRVHALLSQDAGDLDAAERHLRAAIAVHRRTGPRRELAQLSLDLADLLTAMRRADDALTVLADGLTAVDTHTP